MQNKESGKEENTYTSREAGNADLERLDSLMDRKMQELDARYDLAFSRLEESQGKEQKANGNDAGCVETAKHCLGKCEEAIRLLEMKAEGLTGEARTRCMDGIRELRSRLDLATQATGELKESGGEGRPGLKASLEQVVADLTRMLKTVVTGVREKKGE